MDQTNPSSSKEDRKTIEKNRRDQMKALYTKLSSLTTRDAPKEVVLLSDQLEIATDYIKKLEADLEKKKKKKSKLTEEAEYLGCDSNRSNVGGVKLPHIDINFTGLDLEVVLITGLNGQFMFSETIRMLHEEGAEVVSASFSVLDDSIFHNIRSKIGESAPEYEATRLTEKLKKFAYDNSN